MFANLQSECQEVLGQIKPLLSPTNEWTFITLCKKVSLAVYCLGQHSDGKSIAPVAGCALQRRQPSQQTALVMLLCPVAPLREREETHIAEAFL